MIVPDRAIESDRIIEAAAERAAPAEVRLARSRRQLFELLEAQSTGVDSSGAAVFPRSRTMRLLLSRRGLGAAAALCGGLLISRPAIAWRLLQALPIGALARTFVNRLFRFNTTPS